jgi:hypothetical protein
MPQTFVVDQAATFSHVVLLSCDPKLGFQSTEQEKTKDGTPKYELQLVAGFKAFDRAVNEVIKVGIAAERNPADTIPQFTPVQLVGFVVGVMEKTKGDQVVGVQTWYRCDAVRPISAVPNGSRKSEHQPTAS